MPRLDCLGAYGELFGVPEYEVTLEEDEIKHISVLHGAPCGATWEAIKRLKGLSEEEALTRIGLETQFFCTADPSGWDPMYGKSPVHFAAELHEGALKKAIQKAKKHL